MNRRTFLQHSLVLALTAGLARAREEKRAPRILLCSAWQVVNIGDIAHTPGALALLERFVPGADVTLWCFNPLSDEARQVIVRRFPGVQMLETKLTGEGEPADAVTREALDRADFFLHGSGPAMLGWRHAEAFRRRTGRSFGVYGVTYGLYGTPERETLSRAAFVYFRDSVSLSRAQTEGVHSPVMAWAPDTAFAFDLSDHARADAFLARHDLQTGQFLCCISRLRNTPFWTMPGKKVPYDPARDARNQEKKEADHAPLIAAITAVVRETPMKILLCPEDESQIAVTREMLLERLSAKVRARVIWRDSFWLPDEAVAVYERSAGLFGHEMHSPILCISRGIPAIVCRWAEQSSKGTMWRDIGLGDWLFDLDQPEESARVAGSVLAIAQSPGEARARALRARDLVHARLAATWSDFSRRLSEGVR